MEACPNDVKIPRNFSIINQLTMNNDMKKAKKEYKRLMRENGAAGVCKDQCHLFNHFFA
jgi:predicted aldo/keto reductase-like oxidoreductase